MITFTLLTDGSSDTVLLPLLTWLMRQHVADTVPLQPQWADLRLLPNPPKNLIGKITRSVELYPCNILFIHRDAEATSFDIRKQEIIEAFNHARQDSPNFPHKVCVIPVRMQEAWFLFDKQAIRVASGNPNGKVELDLPHIKLVESLPNPKELLHNLLRQASELKGRRLREFKPTKHAHLVADRIDDYSPLRYLNAFQTLENDIVQLIEILS